MRAFGNENHNIKTLLTKTIKSIVGFIVIDLVKVNF